MIMFQSQRLAYRDDAFGDAGTDEPLSQHDIVLLAPLGRSGAQALHHAAQLGLLGTKANLSGLEATWPAFFSMLTLVVGIGGTLLLSFVVTFVFGREYSEQTAKNMLALPVGRPAFVLAKFVVAAAWWVVLVVAVVIQRPYMRRVYVP